MRMKGRVWLSLGKKNADCHFVAKENEMKENVSREKKIIA